MEALTPKSWSFYVYGRVLSSKTFIIFFTYFLEYQCTQILSSLFSSNLWKGPRLILRDPGALPHGVTSPLHKVMTLQCCSKCNQHIFCQGELLYMLWRGSDDFLSCIKIAYSPHFGQNRPFLASSFNDWFKYYWLDLFFLDWRLFSLWFWTSLEFDPKTTLTL